MGTLVLIIIVSVIALNWWFKSKTEKNSPSELKRIEDCLISIEQNPQEPQHYESFIAAVDNSAWAKQDEIFKSSGIYERLLTVLDRNPQNSLPYQGIYKLLLKYKFGLKLSEVKELKNIDSLAIHVITNHVEECFASNLVYKEFINLLDVCWSLNSSSVKIIYYGCLANLRNSSLDPETYEKVMLLLNKCPGLTAEYTRGVYDIALQTLSENSSSPVAKQLCLNAGRWHFGKTRPDNAPTIYDEQAIQNDILVRSS